MALPSRPGRLALQMIELFFFLVEVLNLAGLIVRRPQVRHGGCWVD